MCLPEGWFWFTGVLSGSLETPYSSEMFFLHFFIPIYFLPCILVAYFLSIDVINVVTVEYWRKRVFLFGDMPNLFDSWLVRCCWTRICIQSWLWVGVCVVDFRFWVHFWNLWKHIWTCSSSSSGAHLSSMSLILFFRKLKVKMCLCWETGERMVKKIESWERKMSHMYHFHAFVSSPFSLH